MAIEQTGAIFKSLTFDGESSRTYGVYITGEAVYNAPERDVEMVKIPNRNGAFALDNGRFENIEVTYPAGVFADSETDFAKAISDFRNMLCSRKGYCKLTDEYNPDEFRLAVYKSGLEVDPVALRAGEFDITFECKPQRYLMSGENRFLVTDWNDTTVETGKLISIDDTSGTNGIKDITVDIVPRQDGIPFMTTAIERTPFLFKQTPDDWEKKNTGKYTNLVGADVAVNQLAKVSEISRTVNGITYTVDTVNGTITANGTSTGRSNLAISGSVADRVPYVSGHKCLVSIGREDGTLSTYHGSLVFYKNTTYVSYRQFAQTMIFVDTRDINAITFEVVGAEGSGVTVTNVKFVPQFIDLTQMLGTAIADYAYTLEQSTAGSGIAWLKSNGFDFSKYIAYNAGSLESVNPSAIVTRGFNQWDEEWELGWITPSGENRSGTGQIRSINYIPVLPDTNYYFKTPTTCNITYFDANKNALGQLDKNGNGDVSPTVQSDTRIRVTPSNCRYIRFWIYDTSTYGNNICINISKTTGTPRNGMYRAYNEHEYNIAQYPLHGIFKLVDGNIQADGDVRGDGRTINRNYGRVDLGTLDYNNASATTGLVTAYSNLPNQKYYNNNWDTQPQTINSKGYTQRPYYTGNNDDVNSVDKSIGFVGTSNGAVAIRDIAFAGMTGAQVKAALSGVYLTYPLATPMNETITTGYDNPQVVEEGGTEEFVTSNDVPVGNQTRYGEIYPVSGTDKVHTVVSANLLDESNIIVHKHYNITNGNLVDDTYSLSTPKIPLNGRDKIAVSLDCTYSVPRFQWFVFDESGTKLTTGIDISEELGNSRYGRIIVIDRDAYPTAYSVGFTFDHGLSDMDGTVSDVMITYSETYVDYIPYGTEYESDFGQNIWGGPFALLSGTGDSEYGTVDLGTLTWELIYDHSGTRVFGATISDMEEPPDQTYNNTGLYSNAYALTDYVITDPHTVWIGQSRMLRIGHTVYIEDVNFTDADEFKRGVSGIVLIYKLDEALEISYTALSLDPLEQTVNYIWTKENYDITVEYGTSPGFIVNPTLFGCGPLIETKGYGNISFNGKTISLANGAIGTVNLWNRTHGGSLNGSITKNFATGQFNPTDTFSFTVSHMFTLYEDSPSIVNTNGNATNGYSDNNDGSVTYWIDLPCTFTVGTTNQTTNKSTYTFGSKKVIANMNVAYDSSTGTVVYSVTTETVNNPSFASTTQFGFTISDCNATSTLDRLGDPTYIDCDLGEAYKINDGDIVSLNSFIDLGSNLPELTSGPNKITCDNTFTEVALTPRWWTV